MEWALVTNGVVINLVIADADFIATNPWGVDLYIQLTGRSTKPSIGYVYDSGTDSFSPPIG